MPASASPVFGKRTAPHQARSSPEIGQRKTAMPTGSGSLDLPPEQAAFFAAVRAELEGSAHSVARIVPRSGRAALLSGLVVGCVLAGFNAAGPNSASRLVDLAGGVGLTIDATYLVPGVILLGLLGGARTSAITVMAVHATLKRIGQTSHLAYGLGGAIAAVVLAATLCAAFGHAPAHGWALEVMAGAASGFFYRVFAGAQVA